MKTRIFAAPMVKGLISHTYHQTIMSRAISGVRQERHQTSESDKCRRQMLTSKVDSCAERVQIFIMAVGLDP